MDYLTVAQLGMSIFGCTAFLCVLRDTIKWQKRGCILGLLANPFWWLMVIVTQQWITIPMHILYTYGWYNKAYRLWFKEK